MSSKQELVTLALTLTEDQAESFLSVMKVMVKNWIPEMVPPMLTFTSTWQKELYSLINGRTDDCVMIIKLAPEREKVEFLSIITRYCPGYSVYHYVEDEDDLDRASNKMYEADTPVAILNVTDDSTLGEKDLESLLSSSEVCCFVIAFSNYITVSGELENVKLFEVEVWRIKSG